MKKTTPTKKNLPATRSEGTSVMTREEKVRRDAGLGLSTLQDDNIIPLVRRLQALSPQLKPKHQSYVKGAKAGDIWLKETNPELIKGEVGFGFQPCSFNKDWVEWRPRDEGGGFVGRHVELPSDAKSYVDEKSGRTIYTRRGNDLVDTRYHSGFLIVNKRSLPFVIPMKGTDHQVSRSWMFRMNSKIDEASGDRAPSWANIYRLTTRERTNAVGQSWFTWVIEDESEVDVESEDYDRGRALYFAFKSGEKQVAEEELRAEVEGEDAEEGTM